MTAAEIDPFHLRNQMAEFVDEIGEGAFQGIGVLFAQGVEMQSFQSLQIGILQIVGARSQP